MKIKPWKLLAGLLTFISYCLAFWAGLSIGTFGSDAGMWPTIAIIGAMVLSTVSACIKTIKTNTNTKTKTAITAHETP